VRIQAVRIQAVRIQAASNYYRGLSNLYNANKPSIKLQSKLPQKIVGKSGI
jgi:hypothetical protein